MNKKEKKADRLTRALVPLFPYPLVIFFSSFSLTIFFTLHSDLCLQQSACPRQAKAIQNQPGHAVDHQFLSIVLTVPLLPPKKETLPLSLFPFLTFRLVCRLDLTATFQQ